MMDLASRVATCGGCGRQWPRDPVLEVACPACRADVGQSCAVRRPSEHVHSPLFGGLAYYGHDARELKAAAENKYACGCGIDPAEAQRRLDWLLRNTPNGRFDADAYHAHHPELWP